MTPSSEASKVFDEAKGLLTRTLEADARLLRRVSSLTTDAVRRAAADARARKFPSPTEALSRWAAWNLACWAAAADHGLAFAHEVADATERVLGLSRTEGAAGCGGVEIVVAACPGETAKAAFRVDNVTDTAVSGTFSAGELRSTGDAVVRSTSVVFEPAQLELAAKAQAVIQAIILVPADCVPGQSYLLPLKPVGLPLREITVRIDVGSPATGKAAAAGDPVAGGAVPVPAAKASAGRKPRSRGGAR